MVFAQFIIILVILYVLFQNIQPYHSINLFLKKKSIYPFLNSKLQSKDYSSVYIIQI